MDTPPPGAKRLRRLALAGLIAGAGLAGASAQAGLMPRTALYAVVRSCALAQDTIGRPFPCLAVAPADAAPRTAVLRAPGLRTHVILVPTARIPGIEDPRLRHAPWGALWRDALAARRFVVEGAGFPVPTTAVALAVNADVTRSQDQLHIHAECLRPALLAAIRAERGTLGPDWRPLPHPFAGDRFLARLTSVDEIARENLFASLAQAPGLTQAPGLMQAPGSAKNLSGVTALVVAADPREDGPLIALASATRRRTVEPLFDENCHAARRAPRRE